MLVISVGGRGLGVSSCLCRALVADVESYFDMREIVSMIQA